MKYMERIKDCLTDSQIEKVKLHLISRYSMQNKSKKMSFVFDLLHQCVINCVGCGTDAKCVSKVNEEEIFLKYEDIVRILDKIKKYSEENGLNIYIYFGGGEPFLRKDIIDILSYASGLFGSQNIGIDTNASLSNAFDLIWQAHEYLGYIGISINGLQEYHNWWTNNHNIDSYSRAMGVVGRLCQYPEIAEKLEVTSVATKKNIKTLPELMKVLKACGVKNYSIHRGMPVGRMLKLANELLPSWKEYLILLADIAEMEEMLEMNIHLHHSIEGIYTALLCGEDGIDKHQLIAKNYRSSLGIDAKGNMIIDPWCTSDMWKELCLGNLLVSDSIEEILLLKEGLLKKIQSCYSFHYRCKGCEENCAGGHRIVAAAIQLAGRKDIVLEDILSAFQNIDPACPLVEEKS